MNYNIYIFEKNQTEVYTEVKRLYLVGGFTMDLKKFVSEILDSLKKNEITISTEFNNNSEIVDKSKIGYYFFKWILLNLMIMN